MKTNISTALRRAYGLPTLILLLTLVGSRTYAASGNWAGNWAGNWSVATNWTSNPTVPGTAAGDVVGLTFNITAARTVTIDTTSRIVGTLNIGDPTSGFFAYTLAASGGAGLTFNNSGSDANLGQSATIASDVISAPLTLADNLAVNNSSTLTLSGIIGDAGLGKGITKSGAGNLALNGVNTFSGGVNVTAGRVTLGNTSALGTAAVGLILSGGAFDTSVVNFTNVNNYPFRIDSSFTFIGSQNFHQGVSPILSTSPGPGTVTVNANNLTVGGVLADTNIPSLTKAGPGTLSLAGANIYTGGATVSDGALSFLNTAAQPGSGLTTVYAQATLGLGVGGAGFFSSANVDSLFANTLPNVSMDSTANVGIDTTAGDFTYVTSQTGAMGLTKLGTNTLTITGDLSGLTGPTRVAAGKLRVGAANNFTAGTLTLNGASTTAGLDLRNNTATVFNKDVGLDGTVGTTYTINVDNNGSGTGGTHTLGTISQTTPTARTLTVTGANGYALTITNFSLAPTSGNGTTLNADAKVILQDVTNPQSGYNGGNYDTLTLSGTNTGNQVTGVIEDANGLNATNQPASLVNGGTTRLTKSGAGTWTLSAANLYSGITTVTAGTLALSGSGTLGNGQAALTINSNTNNAILNLGGTSQTISNVTIAGGIITNGTLIGAAYSCTATGMVNAVLAGSGVTLTKTGTGILVLSGANTYSGNTTISAGTLALTGSGSIANSPLITIAAGATNDVSGVSGYTLGAAQSLVSSGLTIGAVNAAAGATFQPGGAGTIGTNRFANAFTLNGNTLAFDLRNSAPTNDLIAVAGTLTNNGVNTIKLNFLSPLPAGTYTLMTYASKVGAGTLALDQTYRNTILNVGPTSVTLTVSGSGVAGNLTWVGNGTSNPWDVNTSALWTTNGIDAVVYLNYDNVTLNDNGSATPALNLTTALNPSSLTVSNDTKNYTLSGAGSLTGGLNLTKWGTGSLTLSTVNSYTGVTTITNGTLALTVGGALGATNTALNANGGTLNLGGFSVTKGAVTINSGTINNGTLTGTNFAAQGGTVNAGLAGAAATLTKTTTNTLILAGNNTYGGLTTLNGGTIQIGDGGTTGSLGSNNVNSIATGTVLAFNRTDAVTVPNRIYQTGAFPPMIRVNSGTVTIAGTEDNSGAASTVTNGATLILAKNSTASVHCLGSGTSTVYTGGLLQLGGTGGDQIYFNHSIALAGGTLDLAGQGESLTGLSGYGTFTDSMGGGNFATTAGLTVNGGTLAVNSGTLSIGTVATINSGATLAQTGGTFSAPSTAVNGLLAVLGGSFSGGAVTVNLGGVITGNGTANSTVTVASGGKVVPGNASVGTLTVDALTLDSGSKLDFELPVSGANDLVNVTFSSGLTINGGGINLYQSGTTNAFTQNGTYDLFQFTDAVAGTGISALAMANAQGGKTYAFGIAGNMVQVTIGDVPPNYWNLDANGGWEVAGNWTALFAPNAATSAAYFGGGGTPITAPRTVSLNGDKTAGTMAFSNSLQSFTIDQGSGGALLLDNNSAPAAINDTAGSHIVTVPITLTNAGVNVSVASASALTLSGVVSGPGPVIKSDTGALTLSGANTQLGGTTVNAGTVTLSGGGTLGDTASALNMNGGTLNLGGSSQAVGTATIAGGTIQNGTLIAGTAFEGQSGTVSASLQGGAPLTKTTTGTLILAGNNSLATGNTVVNSGGTLQVGAANNFTAGTLTLNGNTTTNGPVLSLFSNPSTDYVKDVILTGGANSFYTVNVDNAGAGTGGTHTLGAITQATAAIRNLTVTGSNGYALTITNLNLDPGTGQDTRLIADTKVTLLDVSNPMTGFTAANFDTLTLSGTNTDSVVTGVIEDSSGLNSTNSLPGSLANGGYTRIIKLGTGTWTVSGANLYSGSTTVSAGTLKVGSAVAFTGNSSSLTVDGTGILDLNSNNAAFVTAAAGAATGRITDNSAVPGTSTLSLTNQAAATTISSLITDGATRKVAVKLRGAGHTSSPYFALGNANTFSGGLILQGGTGGANQGTRLRVTNLVATVGTPGAIVSSPFGTGPITIGEAPTDKVGVLFDTVANNTLVNDLVFNTVVGTDVPGFRLDTPGNVLSGTVTANLAPALFAAGATAPGAVSLTGQVTGPSGLTLTNPVTLTLNNATANANSYAGDTVIASANATLNLGLANQIPSGAGKGNVINNGTLNLGGFNATINGLSGIGTVNGGGTLTVGGTLAPGNSAIGSLKINGALTLNAGSQTAMEINKTTATNDLVTGVSTLTYGGTLTVANLAGTLVGGETFKLFSATSYTGNFAATNLPNIAPLLWQWNPTNGTLAAVSAVASNPTNISYSVSGNLLTLTWPASHLGWYAQSNSVSLANTNFWFDIAGSQLATNQVIPISPTQTNVFYRLRQP